MRSSAPGMKSASIAQAQVGLLAHEAAVLVDVVVREFAPQRVLPDLERLLEAVDVLGHAQLGDVALTRRIAIALDIGLGEVLGGGRAELVGA